MLKVDYGSRFVNMKSQDIDKLLRRKDFRTYDADDYLIALDISGDEKVDVEWLRCGISGQNSPRNAKGRKRK